MSAIEEVAYSVASRYLGTYVARAAETARQNSSPKQIHDRVWGTITLTPLEVAIVDSPLIQRLRYLRQLGVAQWVYPSAAHTRFEHSLGVLHQTHQLITAINQASETKYGEAIINQDLTTILRVAALLHDVGHPVLSHVSEYALEVDPRTLLELQRERRKFGENVKLSEIVAAFVVLSKEFEAVLKSIFDVHVSLRLPTASWAGRIPEFVDKVSKCIMGQSISEEIPLLHELISGPFDADKLDYMMRDASMAGIPGIIDISRLIQKITVKKALPTDLHERLSSTIPAKTPHVYLIGFPWSGLSVVDELLLTKMILFSKLYQHPKVVAIEAMIRAIVDNLAKVIDHKRLISFVYEILDDELVLSDEAGLRKRLALKSPGEDTSIDTAVGHCIEILGRLRERNLFVRAFAFSAHNPSNTDGTEDATTKAMNELVRFLSDRTSLAALHQEITDELLKITGHLKLPFSEDFYRSMVVIKKKTLPSQEELRRAYIFPTQGKPKTFGETGIHKDAWSSSFVSAAPKGYIFSPREIAPYVFIATETVVAKKHDVAIPEWLMEEAKQTSDTIRRIKLHLREAGYYNGLPRCIRPTIDRLSKADVDQVVDEFAERFSAIQGTVAELTQKTEKGVVRGGKSAMKLQAMAWLDQFQTWEVEHALDLLKRSRLLGRDDVVAMINEFLKNNPEFDDASIVGLSQGNESSQIIQYYAADVKARFKFYATISDAAKDNRSAPVIFVDDFCASGGQVTNTLGSWFNDDKLKKPGLNEQRRLALEPEKDFLRNHKLAFCFVAAWNDGLKAVQSAIDDLKLTGSVHAHLRDADLPVAFPAESETPGSQQDFKLRCATIGRQLHADEQWDEVKVSQRVLGYGNQGLLLFFPYNAPAQSLTCMWKSGIVNGDDWQPLVPRRKKVT
ncbi:phosphoribosyltransferase-like protein [Rhizobium rhododendri]|uniref:HD domain-containing protein n=1 Tax=Rhizobium rhododendri TaxID=2506430 RepID=A0ABY8IJP0_9HYPH|nr:HD domain-containing protein [Rhizobium rhododendri]WFS23924.1 HD domain-containing protein [Rhizobium rhododendri]